MILLKEKAYKSYSLCLAQESDFLLVKTFLDDQRSRLEKIEFFYPYTDEELKETLSAGTFWGLIDDGRLIATFAIDGDAEYAKKIADIINSCCGKRVVEKAYESSGLMVDEDYRGQGIGGYLMSVAVQEADVKGIDICGVVHTLNVASMSTFFSKSFALKGVWHMRDGYDFVYLLKRRGDASQRRKISDASNVEYADLGDTQRHKELLARGYFGISCDGGRICFLQGE